jgi:hypothetical protein
MSKYTISPILGRKFESKGKKVFYFLTEDVKIRIRLGLSIFEVNTTREIAYQLLFFYLQHYDISRSSTDFSQYKFTSEKQFHDFLSKIHLDEADFEIIDIRKDKEKGYYFKKMLHSKWNIIVTCSKSNTNPISYVCNLPGISPHDKRIITGHVFEHILIQNGQTKYDIKELFGLLEKEKIIRRIQSPILYELGETRYNMIDDNLKQLIFHCWKIFGAVHIRMQFTWKNFRRPTKEEIIWLKIIWGNTRANVFLKQYKQARANAIIKRHMKKKRKEKLQNSKDKILSDIHMHDKAIKEGFENVNTKYSDVMKEYRYPCEMLLKLIFPIFLRELHAFNKI